jgi:hypothetical protein
MVPPQPLSSGLTLPELDRKRIAKMIAGLGQEKGDGGDVTATGGSPQFMHGILYTAQVDIGTPAQSFTLAVDTGSANTWVGADSNNKYDAKKSSTMKNEGKAVSVGYGIGEFQGRECRCPYFCPST